MGWPSVSPCASVLMELGWPDADRLSTGRPPSLWGRASSMAVDPHCPIPEAVLQIASGVPRNWAHHSQTSCSYVGAPCPDAAGVSTGSPPGRVCWWFDDNVRGRLDHDLRVRLIASASTLTLVHFPLSSVTTTSGPDAAVFGRGSSTIHARAWGLARWGHDPFRGGRAARHRGVPLGCPLCSAPVGDLVHCLTALPTRISALSGAPL